MSVVTADTLVKLLGPNRTPFHGGSGQWPEPGEWREVEGKIVPCENGLHVCTIRQMVTRGWAAPEMWLVEVEGERVDHVDKTAVRRARLTEQVSTWNERTMRLWACDCAERVLHIYERENPGDARPRQAIEVARRFANGQATREELAAARDAARAAARAAAWAAARAAAWAAARDAAWDAARDAAWAAARDAAWDAARDAAWDAARDAEIEWQLQRLAYYLSGEVQP